MHWWNRLLGLYAAVVSGILLYCIWTDESDPAPEPIEQISPRAALCMGITGILAFFLGLRQAFGRNQSSD